MGMGLQFSATEIENDMLRSSDFANICTNGMCALNALKIMQHMLSPRYIAEDSLFSNVVRPQHKKIS